MLIQRKFSRSSITSSSNSESTDESEVTKGSSADCQKAPPSFSSVGTSKDASESFQSGLFLYVDLHGHASKKGNKKKEKHFILCFIWLIIDY